MAKPTDAHPTERTTLHSVRLALASEPAEGRSLNVAMVTQLTGGDSITARKMCRDFYTFLPTHKLQLATNHKPRIKETKAAIWERVKLVPWTAQFLEGNPRTNPRLESELRAELPGILAWAVRGCLDWQEIGLSTPGAVRAATQEFREEQDRFGAFLEERCVFSVGARVSSAELRAAYEAWCSANGDHPISPNAVAERLRERGLEPHKSHGTKVWIGLGLLVDGQRQGAQVLPFREVSP